VVISRDVFSGQLDAQDRAALQEQQLRPLGHMVLEAAAAYYDAAAGRLRQRQLDLTASLGSCPPELAASIAFKVCVCVGGGGGADGSSSSSWLCLWPTCCQHAPAPSNV
jgi:hypothetical protein